MGTWFTLDFSNARTDCETGCENARTGCEARRTEMAIKKSIKKLLAAAGAVVVLALASAGHQHGVEQRPAGVTLTNETPRNTPWT